MSTTKILIVEDERLIARDIALTLEHAGYEVVDILSNGNEVIDRVPKLKPDLVLLDINILGSIDGVQVAEYLHRYWQTAVVFLTANSDESTFDRAKHTGAYGFLIKPYHSRQLLTTVENAILTHQNNQSRLANLRRNITAALPHELNTALNSILGLSEIIATEYNNLSDEEVLEFISDIQSSAKRLHFFTSRYLFFAELELLLVNPDRVSIMTQMEPVLHTEQALLDVLAEFKQKSDREFILDICNTNLQVPLEFFNVLMQELIDNSLRYSIPNTPIVISTAEHYDYFSILVSNQTDSFDLDSISSIGAYVKSKSLFQDKQGSCMGLGIVYRILSLLEGVIDFNFNNSCLEVKVKLPNKSCVLQLD